VIISIAERQPEPLSQRAPGVPIQLERIVNKALAKNREDRYQTADDFLIDLKNLKREVEIQSDGELSSPALTAAGVAETTNAPELITSRIVHRGMTASRIAIVAGMIALVIIAGWFLLTFRQRSTSTPKAEIRSLAVLPMANLSGDSAHDYFADGMTETVTSGLAKVGALRVISKSAAMQYKGSTKTLDVIAKELNVDALVEGSVSRVGDRVQVAVQLVDGHNSAPFWKANYDRDLRDIPALQNEVARDVTQAIQVKVTPQEEVRLTRARTIDPKAYDYFLRGKFYSSRQTKDDNQTAIEMFEQAVAADPNFAAAYADLAQVCVWRLFLFTPGEKQWEERAFVAVEKALTLDPDLPEAHLARGRLLWTPANNFPHDKVIQEYHRAIDLNPNLDEAHQQLALVYGHVGRLDEALQELEKTVAINPSNHVARYRFGEIFLFQGKYEQAAAILQNTPKEVNPALVGHQSAWALLNLGRKQEASAALEQLLKDYPEDNGGLFTSIQAVVAASNGQQLVAEQKIKSALEKGRGFGHFHHTQYHIACAYALMNKHDEAIKWLELAAQNGFPCYPFFEREASLNNLRQDPRFITLMEKLKQQWEYYKTI